MRRLRSLLVAAGLAAAPAGAAADLLGLDGQGIDPTCCA